MSSSHGMFSMPWAFPFLIRSQPHATKIVRWPPPPIVTGIPSESPTGIRSGSVTVYAGIRTGGIIIWNGESQMESWLKSCLGVEALQVFGRSARAGVEL